ncbi:uncharacterized protein LOC111620859 [Centruroides sculpturatus]|uniref:uncharacterized protein LOC111620859 n=1 Tax=Centruroides sculpturatus TaxID=218467 RepID=UPI000C6CF777|nr:uncharacterized protein LOC111620859 [Centruroides sculpturatus]
MASFLKTVIVLIFFVAVPSFAAPVSNSTEIVPVETEANKTQTTEIPTERDAKAVEYSNQEQELATEIPSTMPTTEVLIDPKNLNERFITCEQKIAIERPNFEVYPNGSVIIPYLEAMLAKGDYFITGNLLVICVGN